MHKHFTAGVVILTVFITVAFISKTFAQDLPSWLASPITIQKQADTSTVPATVSGNGNIDCSRDDAINCSVVTNYGLATSNSSVRLNTSGNFIPVNTYMDGKPHFFPVPNSDESISYYNAGAVYGINMAFNYTFTGSVIKTGSTFTINRPPDGKLADKSKHPLAADTNSLSFSENGRWMVVSIPNIAIARVDMQTFEVIPFAPGFNYAIGLDPAVKTAVTNDGRYAVVSSNNFSTFKIYDLDTCPLVPDTISGPVACLSRDLNVFLQNSVPGFNSATNIRFMNKNNLALYASYKSGDSNKIARYIVSDDNSTHQHDLLSLGDSYISGEGTFSYFGSTDTETNKCHSSAQAYPYLIGKYLSFNSYHSVACSGAITNDITDTGSDYSGQFNKIPRNNRAPEEMDSIIANFVPGNIDQIDFVKTYQPQIVTISIGGNDMGFSQILKDCVRPSLNNTCYSTYEDRLELVRQINNNVYPKLVQTYQMIKSAGPPDMRIYVIGYPQIAKPAGDCGLNVHLNSDEIQFSEDLINYLDSVIQLASSKTGVYYVNTQNAFDGHRLCETGPGSIAVNGLTAGNDRPTKLHGPLGDESYHPNSFGHQLLENTILSYTHNLSSPMPQPKTLVLLPNESNLSWLNVPHSGHAINNPDYTPGIAPDLAYISTPFNVSISGSQVGLPANTNLVAEIHSSPISLGNFKTDSSGNLSTQISLPAQTPVGNHTLHFYGTNLAGNLIDIYKYIYVGASATDLDGNNIPDNAQKCIGLDPSDQDYDQDGVDDSCDAQITQPSSPSVKTASSNSRVVNNSNSNQINQHLVDAEFSDNIPDTSYLGKLSTEVFNNPYQPVSIFSSNVKPKKAIFAISSGQKTDNNKGSDIVLGMVLIGIGCFGLVFKGRQIL